MESIRKGREGREKFGSAKGRKTGTPSSTTNREKKRNKPLMMAVQWVPMWNDSCVFSLLTTAQLEQCCAEKEGVAARQADSSACCYRQAEEDEALDLECTMIGMGDRLFLSFCDLLDMQRIYTFGVCPPWSYTFVLLAILWAA
jgi:hypothetical protein